MSTQGLYHYPSVITNASVAVEIAGFGANNLFPRNTTAAIINNFGGREQMLWFTSWASEWSPTSNYFAHAYITWMTRGLCELPLLLHVLSPPGGMLKIPWLSREKLTSHSLRPGMVYFMILTD